jgi:HNH endonuclease
VSLNPIDDEQCPYCGISTEITDDHIFPQFLGGQRTIRVCRRCNNTFGHTFEGKVSAQLARLQIFISHFGLNLSRNDAVWRAALTVRGEDFDLTPGPAGAQYHLSKPVVRKDEKGRIIGGRARSLSEANKMARGLIRSGHAREVDITANEDPVLENIRLDLSDSFNDDLFRLATKMVASLAVASSFDKLISESQIPDYLHGRAAWGTSVAYCDVTPLNQLRPPLAHTIYLETGQPSYGIVLLFGHQKIWVPLPNSTERKAILASLDSISGEESFGEVEPIGPRSVPAVIEQGVALKHLQGMLDTLADEAVARGANERPALYVGQFDLGTPLPSWWTTSTVRYMFPNYPPRYNR